MEFWCYFSGFKEQVCEKSVSASSENGGENSGMIEFSEAEEKQSSLIFDSNSSRTRDSSVVDLKLGSTSDRKESTLSLNSFISNHNLSSAAKRFKIPFCRAYGCKKDLRSSKDYHKRHKVCEIHSKTAKVIVDGVEQRFCQQCSRFHILAEFDNGKRSCRRRLAGHNERRRKPRVGVNSTRLRMFQDYNGSRFQETSSTSSIVLHQQKYEAYDWSRPVHVVHGMDHSPEIDSLVTSESIPHTSGKHPFSPHVGENSAALTRSKIDGISELCRQDSVTCSDICSPPSSLFHNSTVQGSKNLMLMESSSYFQELSSGHAFSLLSSVSQDISYNLSSRACSSHPLMLTSDSIDAYDLSKLSQSSQP